MRLLNRGRLNETLIASLGSFAHTSRFDPRQTLFLKVATIDDRFLSISVSACVRFFLCCGRLGTFARCLRAVTSHPCVIAPIT